MEVDSWYMIKNFTIHIGRLNQIYITTNEKCTIRKTFKTGRPTDDIQCKAKELVLPSSCERTILNASTSTELSTLRGEIIEVR